MLVECGGIIELSVTNVAFPATAVPGMFGGRVSTSRSLMPGDLPVRDRTGRILLANNTENGFAI